MWDKKKINYKEDRINPIKSIKCTAWSVKLPNGIEHLMLWEENATIENVHQACLAYYPQGFILRRVDVGDMIIKEHIQTYCGDGRGVDQDWNIIL